MSKQKESKMNKEIIIDGVDVSECEYLVAKEACRDMNSESVDCKRNNNCLFKQLARKTQECEELSILAQEESARNGLIEYELNDKLKQKMRECEELIKERDYLKQIVDGCPDVACENGGFCAIDIENKNLRKQVKDMIEWQKEVIRLFDKTCRCDSLDEEVAICKENGKECISIVGCRDRYRKALEEIEEIVEIVNEACIDSQSDCKSCNFSCEHKDILDIISKAKEEA